MTSEHGGKVDRGPLSESMYTACSTHLNMGLACTLSITREYMEHGGRLSANSALTMYYLPVYPPYSDYNYGLRCPIRYWPCNRDSIYSASAIGSRCSTYRHLVTGTTSLPM
jgi:hypothetical protein